MVLVQIRRKLVIVGDGKSTLRPTYNATAINLTTRYLWENIVTLLFRFGRVSERIRACCIIKHSKLMTDVVGQFVQQPSSCNSQQSVVRQSAHNTLTAIFENYVAEIRLDGKAVQLALWDTAYV